MPHLPCLFYALSLGAEWALIRAFGYASWFMVPTLVICGAGLLLGSRAWWTRWLPLCVFCAQLWYMFLLVMYETIAELLRARR